MKKIIYLIFSIYLLLILASCSSSTSDLETFKLTLDNNLTVVKPLDINLDKVKKNQEVIILAEIKNKTYLKDIYVNNKKINTNSNKFSIIMKSDTNVFATFGNIKEDKIMKNPTITIKTKIGDKIQEDMVIQLRHDIAPVTVANFIGLVEKKFYNNLIFHRVIKDFMIQGGDPKGNGMGGPGYSIIGEFDNNSIKNSLSHVRGTISMARSQSYNSAGSQFFICHADSKFLDKNYAAFGTLISGFTTLDNIANVKTDNADKPLNECKIIEITADIEGYNTPNIEKYVN